MIRQHPDDPARPWDLIPARSQTGELEPIHAGSAAGASYWHTPSGRYFARTADATMAAKVEGARGAADHLRAVAWLARQVRTADAPAFRSAVDLYAFARRRARRILSAADRDRLERAVRAMWAAMELVNAAPVPPAPAAARRAA